MAMIKINDEWYVNSNHITTVEHFKNNEGVWVVTITMVDGQSYGFYYENEGEAKDLVKTISNATYWR